MPAAGSAMSACATPMTAPLSPVSRLGDGEKYSQQPGKPPLAGSATTMPNASAVSAKPPAP